MLKLHPYELRLNPKNIANRHEGENPVKVITEKPLLSLFCLLSVPPVHSRLFLKAAQGIFEHCIHQCTLRAYGSDFDSRIKEFLWNCTDSGRPLIVGLPVTGHSRRSPVSVSRYPRSMHPDLLF